MLAEQESPWPVTLFSLDWIWSLWICPALKTQDQQTSGNNDQVSLLHQPNLSESAQLDWLYLLSDPASDILEDRPLSASLPHINTSIPPLSPQSSHSPIEATTIPQAPSNAGPPQSKGTDATLSSISPITQLLDTNEDKDSDNVSNDEVENEDLLVTNEDGDSLDVNKDEEINNNGKDVVNKEDEDPDDDGNHAVHHLSIQSPRHDPIQTDSGSDTTSSSASTATKPLHTNEDGEPIGGTNEDEDTLDTNADEDHNNNGEHVLNNEDEHPDDAGNHAVDHTSIQSPRRDPIQTNSGSDTTSSSASTATKPLHTNEDGEPIGGTNEDEDTLDTNADEDPDNDSNDKVEDEDLLDANDHDEPLDTNKDDDPDNDGNTTVDNPVNAVEITETSPSPAFHRDGDLASEDKEEERCRRWRLFFEDIIVEGLEVWNMDMSKIEQGFAEKGCPDGEVIDALRSAWIRGEWFPAGYKPLDGKSHAEIQQRVDDRLQRQELARFPGFFA